MSVYSQVGGIPDVVPYATDIPCRFVVQDQITPTIFPWSDRVAWITYDAIAPVQPTVTTFAESATVNYGSADRLEVATHPGVLWVVLFTEVVIPDGEPTYLRSWVAPVWW